MLHKSRPKLKPELEPIDKIIELIALLELIVLVALPIYFISQLPESIPRHFGANGLPYIVDSVYLN